MAAPVKNFIDLQQIVKEWKNLEGVKGDYHLKNLKLEVTNIEWTNVTCLSDPQHAKTSQASAEYVTQQNQRCANIKVKVKSKKGTHVTINTGVVSDLHQNFKLPLAGLPQNIIDATGPSLEIDVGVSETDRNAQTLKYFTDFPHTIDQTDSNAPTVARAEVASRTGDYVAQFTGTAQLEGEVICSDGRSVEQAPIGEVVTCLKSKSKHVDKLCVTGQGLHVEWKIGGECHFFLGTDVTVSWK
ncbi:unnamed protein product [Lymnaea stagnalis]|uniref:Uncharacterized protein n=1 Tax=Lymnaea stagnalis TaxID=6523 RepID=A0AAV2HQU6_LYMST